MTAPVNAKVAIILDADLLLRRISQRSDAYLSLFALRRTREHFEEIFKTFFWKASPELLASLEGDFLQALYLFHEKADELKWYFLSSDDMPATMETYLEAKIRELEKHLAALKGPLPELPFAPSDADEPPPFF